MEIALVARQQGAAVRYINIRRALPSVEDASWLPRAVDLNTQRIGRARPILQAAGVELVDRPVPAAEARAAAARARELLAGCADVAAVCALRHDRFTDIGWGVLSSIVDTTRNPYASLQTHRPLFEGFLTTALLAYETARRAIRDFAPDAVALFNGRYASVRALFAAAQAEGVRALIHDRGCDSRHYWIASEPILDPDYLQRCIREFWRPELADAGEEFYTGRRARVERNWHSFTKGQEAGRIPQAMQDGSRWIVFFTSSDDEYVAVGDKYVNKAFPAQLDAIRAVEQAVARLPGYRLCVRVHPNIASKSREQQEYWRALRVPAALIVGAEARFDSYAILDRAHVACSYGSTVGIEATYWDRPSLLMGRSIYDRLGATFNASGADDVLRFLRQPEVMPKIGALMYGAFFARHGTPYRHYEARDLFRGRIQGVDLDPPAVRLLRKLAGRG